MTQKQTLQSLLHLEDLSSEELTSEIYNITDRYEVLEREFIKIAKEYNYPQELINNVLATPITLGEVVDAYYRGCKPDVSWVKTALMHNE